MYSENRYIRKNIRTIRSEIRKADKVAQFKNQYAVVNSVPYIILGKASEVNDQVKVMDMDGKMQSIEVESISKVGRTKQLIHKGEIYFKSGDKVETVTIYQAGGAILLLLQDECHVSDKGSTISVNVQSNIEFGVQMPDVDWITAEPNTRGMSSHTLRYTISPNEEYDSRMAEIVFYDNNSNLKETVKIVQVQKDAIIVAQNEYIVESDGGNLEFEVNTNVDFEVSTSVDWIKQNAKTRSLDTKLLSFTIEENTAETDREGLIIISYGELRQEIKVTQQRKIYFNFSI